MKCQILFSWIGKIRKNNISLSSGEFAQRVLSHGTSGNLGNELENASVEFCSLATSGIFRASTIDRKTVNRGMSHRIVSLIIPLYAIYVKKKTKTKNNNKKKKKKKKKKTTTKKQKTKKKTKKKRALLSCVDMI